MTASWFRLIIMFSYCQHFHDKGENARKIVPIDSPQFGRVMAVCVGAMMVGSIKTTLNEGDDVKRGQEFGYFAFGTASSLSIFLFLLTLKPHNADLL